MDNLRLILLVLGVVVVAAIWAFEAWRRRRNAAARDDPFADFDSDDLAIEDLPPWQAEADAPDRAREARPGAEQASPQRSVRREPESPDLFDEQLVEDDDNEPPLGDLSPLVAERDVAEGPGPKLSSTTEQALPPKPSSDAPAPAADPAPLSRSSRTVVGDTAAEPAQTRTAADDIDDGPPRQESVSSAAREAPTQPDLPATRVVSLLVMARPGRRFVGHQIRAALESVGLRYGEMQIFHYHDDDDDDTPLFSAVNALKPGTFDLARLGELSTTGVALFMQVPGPAESSRVFEVMLDTARHLAERLGGDLGDARRRSLSAARLEELRAIVAGDTPS